MRNPLWILTTSLTLLLLIVAGILTLMQKDIPNRTSLAPSTISQEAKRPLSPVDVRQIYEHDLFKTYKPVIETVPDTPKQLTVPQPPAPVFLPPASLPSVTFIDPLQISIKGIIRTGDDYNNRAIIVDEKSKTEDIYSIGDTVEDAEILSIEKNKVLFIRSNGQQETIFLSAQDAQSDPVFSAQKPWDLVIRKTGNNSYTVDVDALTERVGSVAAFIEMLDITTALQGGKSIGARIGQMQPDSLGYILGLQQNDIVTAINDMPVRSTKERIHAYHALKTMKPGNSIPVVFTRNGKEHKLTLTLERVAAEDLLPEEIQEGEEGDTTVHEDIDFTVPSSKINAQRKDKAAIQQFGSRAGLLQRTV